MSCETNTESRYYCVLLPTPKVIHFLSAVLPGRGDGRPGGQCWTGTRETSRAGQGTPAAMAVQGTTAAMVGQGSPAGPPWPYPAWPRAYGPPKKNSWGKL